MALFFELPIIFNAASAISAKIKPTNILLGPFHSDQNTLKPFSRLTQFEKKREMPFREHQETPPKHPLALVLRADMPRGSRMIADNRGRGIGANGVLIQNSKINGFNNNNMLSEDVILQTAQNRRCEKPLVPLASILLRIDFEAYQSLIEWVFEASNQLGLHSNTKFLARTYFDLTISSSQDLQVSQYLATFIACLCLAIKFNELREVSERLTPQVMLASAEVIISTEKYLLLEMMILSAIRFRFKFTSPLDYVEGYLERFPFFPRSRHILPTIIEFALIQPQACQFSAEELFYGAVLSQFTSQRVALTDFQKNVLLGLTDCWGNAQTMSGIIASGVNRYGSPQSNL